MTKPAVIKSMGRCDGCGRLRRIKLRVSPNQMNSTWLCKECIKKPESEQ